MRARRGAASPSPASPTAAGCAREPRSAERLPDVDVVLVGIADRRLAHAVVGVVLQASRQRLAASLDLRDVLVQAGREAEVAPGLVAQARRGSLLELGQVDRRGA